MSEKNKVNKAISSLEDGIRNVSKIKRLIRRIKNLFR